MSLTRIATLLFFIHPTSGKTSDGSLTATRETYRKTFVWRVIWQNHRPQSCASCMKNRLPVLWVRLLPKSQPPKRVAPRHAISREINKIVSAAQKLQAGRSDRD